MDRLAGLVDRLIGREHNQCRVFDLDGLGVLGGPDGRVGGEADIVCASERSRKTKLSRGRAAPVEASGEERASALVGNEQFGMDGAGEGGIVVARVGDQQTDGGITAGEVLRLAKNANPRVAEDARDGLDPGHRCTASSRIQNDRPPVAKQGPRMRRFRAAMFCCQEPSFSVMTTRG